MKKLEHCIEIELRGPLDIEGFATGFVEQCVDKALNSRRVEYALRAVAALVADFYGSYGSASAANASDYVNTVASETLSCLTDQRELEAYFKEKIAAEFKGRVTHKMTWVYWWV